MQAATPFRRLSEFLHADRPPAKPSNPEETMTINSPKTSKTDSSRRGGGKRHDRNRPSKTQHKINTEANPDAGGIEVCLVNARHVKGVPGKKTDVCDAQWLQQPHAAGLLRTERRPGFNLFQL